MWWPTIMLILVFLQWTLVEWIRRIRWENRVDLWLQKLFEAHIAGKCTQCCNTINLFTEVSSHSFFMCIIEIQKTLFYLCFEGCNYIHSEMKLAHRKVFSFFIREYVVSVAVRLLPSCCCSNWNFMYVSRPGHTHHTVAYDLILINGVLLQLAEFCRKLARPPVTLHVSWRAGPSLWADLDHHQSAWRCDIDFVARRCPKNMESSRKLPAVKVRPRCRKEVVACVCATPSPFRELPRTRRTLRDTRVWQPCPMQRVLQRLWWVFVTAKSWESWCIVSSSDHWQKTSQESALFCMYTVWQEGICARSFLFEYIGIWRILPHTQKVRH